MCERWASCARANDLCNLWKNMLLKNRAFFSDELNVIGHSRIAYFSTPTQIWYQIILKRNIYRTTTQGAYFLLLWMRERKDHLKFNSTLKKNFLGTILRFLNYGVSGANGVCFWLLYTGIDFFTNLIFLSTCMLRSFCYSILRLNERWDADFQHIKACVELG